MSISPAPLILSVASTESSAAPRPALSPALPASAPAATGADESPAPAFSTDMRVDDQHQVYYEFVDAQTGEVMFEIPPEALREIGESLRMPLEGDTGGHSLDVKT